MTYCWPTTYYYSSCRSTDWSASSISGRMSLDANRDNTERGATAGTWDAGVAGKQVYLLDMYGRVVASTTTATDGTYKFAQLKAGNYQVSFEGSSGHSFASKDVGDNRYDSDVGSTGRTDWIKLGSCQTVNDVDASIQRDVGRITGSVFMDTQCDGINGTMQTVPGTTYVMEAEAMCKSGALGVFSGAQASGGKFVKLNCGTTGTLSDSFDGVTGTYNVVIRVQDENDGRSTIQLKVNGVLVNAVCLNQDDDGAGSDSGGFSDFVIQNVRINAGSNIQLVVNGNGGEFVRLDKITLQGQPTTVLSPEPPKANVKIMLVDANGATVATTYTDANGNYKFDNVATGQYKIVGVAPDGTHFTLKDVGSNNAIDSDVGSNGASDMFTVVKGGLTDIDLGVCEIDEGSLSGRYFYDADRSNTDNGDAGVAGKLVTLLKADGVTVVATTYTNSNGTYAFTGVEAGNYVVQFQDSTGQNRSFVAQDQGGNDTVDSDVNTGTGKTGTVTVVANVETKDVDAGVADNLGSLSGRYFFDAARDNTDTSDAGVAGKTVTLYRADGTTVVTTTQTDGSGNYTFAGVVPGSYVVGFQDSTGQGRTFVQTDIGGNDAIDSDANATTGKTGVVTVGAGQNVTDVDVGVLDPNEAPIAVDDTGMTCADETLDVNLLTGDSDPDGDTISVASIFDEDETAGVGGSITLASGATVTLNANGTVTYNGIAAHAGLVIGAQAVDSFSYTITDGELTATADVDVTICGDLNTAETLQANVFNGATIDFTLGSFPGSSPADGYEATFENLTGMPGFTIADFGGPTVVEIYCIDALQPAATRVLTTASIYVATEASALAAGINAAGAANMDLVNWLLNTDIVAMDNGDGNGTTYTDFEVQEAIWTLINGDQFVIGNYAFAPDDNNGVLDGAEIGTIQNVLEIAALAVANGEGFFAGAGDILGLLLDPTAPISQEQPFLIGVAFDTFAQDCLCA